MFTKEFLPCPELQPYIRAFVLREFDTQHNDLIIPIHAKHEVYLVFLLKARNLQLTLQNPSWVHVPLPLNEINNSVLGLQTVYHGNIIYNGGYVLFSVQMKPDGFFRLFGIPGSEIINKAFYANDLISGTDRLNGQLLAATNPGEMIRLTEEFLLQKLHTNQLLNKHKAVNVAANLIVKQNGIVDIKKLSDHVNMSLKSFERLFTEYVGVPPKLYSLVTRFNYAVLLKTMNPIENWTSIALSCGYYDQAHFVKEFRLFSDHTPKEFIQRFTTENFLNIVDP